MKAHELAETLLKNPDAEVSFSVDISTEDESTHGDRLFTDCVFEVVSNDKESTICIGEVQDNEGDYVDVEAKKQ